MKKRVLITVGVVIVALVAWLILKPASRPAETVPTAVSGSGSALVSVTVPQTLSSEAEMGKRGFDSACADCHGQNAAGVDGKGPPLVHKYYEPSHHGDMAFFLAVERGVRAHHWPFGDMPPQKGLTKADVQAIVTYVRELQRANGIN